MSNHVLDYGLVESSIEKRSFICISKSTYDVSRMLMHLLSSRVKSESALNNLFGLLGISTQLLSRLLGGAAAGQIMAPKRTREQAGAGLDNESEMSSDCDDEDDKPTVSDLDNDLM